MNIEELKKVKGSELTLTEYFLYEINQKFSFIIKVMLAPFIITIVIICIALFFALIKIL